MSCTKNSVTVGPDDANSDAARQLIAALCAELGGRYGTPPTPFSPSEAAAARTVFIVARLGDKPVGCGALRRINEAAAEIKRMYVAPQGRRLGIARRILAELERHAADFGYRAIRLETGNRQPEAISLYESCGYRRIDPYGPYIGNPVSLCYQKDFPP